MSLLTQPQLEAVNVKFGLDLDYSQAPHYRAAQVIYSLWKEKDPDFSEPKSPDLADCPSDDSLSSDQGHGDTA